VSHQAVTWAYEQDIQPCGTKFVLVTLANYANSDGYCYPSQETLAKDTGLSVRAVRDHIGKLEAVGCVQRERRHAKSGQRRSDGFWLVGFKALPADVAASQPADSAASQPARVAASATSLPADSVKPTGNERQSLPAESAAPYIEGTVNIEPSEEPEDGGAVAVVASPHGFVLAFLEERGADDADVPKEWMSEQRKHAQALIEMGCSEGDLRRLTRYALSQSWRTTIVTVKTLRGMYGDWIMEGMPSREPLPVSANRPRSRSDRSETREEYEARQRRWTG
jgi:hypothetical protein